MLTIHGNAKRLCTGITRRDLLSAGSLGLGGVTLDHLLRLDSLQAKGLAPIAGKAKSCIVLFLYGAWSQLDTLDMKPDSPREVRGEFQPISTSVPGIQISEHLPRLARRLDRLSLVRSMTHSHPTHCVAYSLSGIPDNPLRDPKDYWPFFGSTLDYLWNQSPKDTPIAGMPRNLCLPWELNSHSTNRSHRGLTPAWLGQQWETVVGQFSGTATRSRGAPSADGEQATYSRYDPHDGISVDSRFQIIAPTLVQSAPKGGLPHKVAQSGAALPAEITLNRFRNRKSLLNQLSDARRDLDQAPSTEGLNYFQQMAFDMISSGQCAASLDVTLEPQSVRERYGHTLFGQAALAARRLVEAGARVVTVYWDEFGPANTGWDTHVNHFPRLKEGLCPTLDQAYDALMTDLEQRGMLDDTVVVLISEHGRTPRLRNKPGGARDHWSYAYSGLFAGAGIRKGQVLGATDKQAGYPVDHPLNPKDILATLYHLLGFDVMNTRTYDSLGRPRFILPYGKVVSELLS